MLLTAGLRSDPLGERKEETPSRSNGEEMGRRGKGEWGKRKEKEKGGRSTNG